MKHYTDEYRKELRKLDEEIRNIRNTIKEVKGEYTLKKMIEEA